jgi:hypothetical protein
MILYSYLAAGRYHSLLFAEAQGVDVDASVRRPSE